jgi:hypothetical protein
VCSSDLAALEQGGGLRGCLIRKVVRTRINIGDL